jgi:hypothetical protein
MLPQIQSAISCPKCGTGVVLCHADLDQLLENDHGIEVVCLYEHEWPLNAEDKTRLRNQRKEWKQVVAR